MTDNRQRVAKKGDVLIVRTLGLGGYEDYFFVRDSEIAWRKVDSYADVVEYKRNLTDADDAR